jgi:hypothetical protein
MDGTLGFGGIATMSEYSFTHQYRQIVEMLWNGGQPRTCNIKEFAALGMGAYGNHTKLEFAPWGLVVDDVDNHHRKLTPLGILFAQGKTTIPKDIEGDGDDPSAYTRVVGTADILISDV